MDEYLKVKKKSITILGSIMLIIIIITAESLFEATYQSGLIKFPCGIAVGVIMAKAKWF